MEGTVSALKPKTGVDSTIFLRNTFFSLRANTLTYQGGRSEPSSPVKLNNSLARARARAKPRAVTHRFLTANLGDLSCGLRASKMLGWKTRRSPPKRERRSARISRASSWTETSFCWATAEDSRPTMVLQTENNKNIFASDFHR